MNAQGIRSILLAVASAANQHRGLAAALALAGAGMAASSASASTILTSGLSTGGISLNSANVLLAAGPYGTSTVSGGAYTNATSAGVVQGVSFAPMSASTGTVSFSYTDPTSGVGANLSAYNSSNAQISAQEIAGAAQPHGFLYFNANVSGAGGTVSPQPTDSSSIGLTQVIENGIDFTPSANYLLLTISGLQSGQAYSVDLIQSLAGNNGSATRTQLVSFGSPFSHSTTYSGTPTDTSTLTFFSEGGGTVSPGFDTNEQWTATGGQIQIYIYDNIQAPLFSGVVVSSVPEPASLGLLALGSLGLLARRRRRAASPAASQ